MSMTLIKKRRGRPPKYLNVWKQQYLDNLHRKKLEEEKKIRSETSTGETMEEPTQAEKDVCKPPTAAAALVAVDGVTKDVRASPVLVEIVPDACSPPVAIPLVQQPYPCANAHGTPPSPIPTNGKQSPVTAVDREESKVGVLTDDDLVFGNKRKPGRPVGSTKRAKQVIVEPPYQIKTTSEEFSLRKFFEAGGRDYNEYLEWLKKRGSVLQHNSMLQNGAVPFPGVFLPPQSPGGTPIPIPLAGFQFQQQARLLSSLSPQNTAVPLFNPRDFAPVQLHPVSPTSPPAALVSMAAKSTTFHNDCALDLSNKQRLTEEERLSQTNKLFDRMRQTIHVVAQSPDLRSPKSDSDSPLSTDSGRPTSPETQSVTSPPDSRDVTTWDVDHVVKFVSTVPGCSDYAEAFREHRIDGATLPHLSEDHLLKFVNMKLGPAIRLQLEVSRLIVR